MQNLLKTALAALTTHVLKKFTPVNDLLPTPGSISSTMSVKSLNHILSLAAPLGMNEVLTNKTFNVGMDKEGWMGLYSLEFGGIHSNTVDGPKKTDLSFKKNSDTIVLTLAGIDLDLTMQDASAQLLHVVKADIESVVVTNFTLQVELFTTTTDQVHWALGGKSWFHLDNLNITMKQHRWNDMLATIHTPMMNGINYFISYWVPRWIGTKIKHFNAKVASEGPMTFMSKILGKNKPLNTTMTKYP